MSALEKAARFNKVTLPDDVENLVPRPSDDRQLEEVPDKRNIWDAFRTPNLRKHTIVMFCVW